MIYTIKWTETHHYSIDIDTAGEAEALEEFWTRYGDAPPEWHEAEIDSSGPQNIKVTGYLAVMVHKRVDQ